MQDRYTEIELNWPDLQAATGLCGLAPCVYLEREGSGITEEFLSHEICPGVTGSFSPGVAVILGRALVWCCFEPSAFDLVPPGLRQATIQKVMSLDSNIEEGCNPVRRIEVHATAVGSRVSLSELSFDDYNFLGVQSTTTANRTAN